MPYAEQELKPLTDAEFIPIANPVRQSFFDVKKQEEEGRVLYSTSEPSFLARQRWNWHGTTGLLAEPGDVLEFASCLTSILNDAPLRHAMGQRARENALSEYSPDVVIDKTIALYRRVIAEHSQG